MKQKKDSLKIKEVLSKAANIQRFETVTHDQVEGKTPVYILQELDTVEWNRLAMRINQRSFKGKFGRNPIDYSEVEAWINFKLATPLSVRGSYGE